MMTSLLLILLCFISSVVIISADTRTTDDGNDDDDAQNQNNHRQPPVFVHKTVIIPHDSKKHRGGEDSASTSEQILVVADGVGGWAKSGINPGLFSRELTNQIITNYDYEKSREKGKGNDNHKKKEEEEAEVNYLKELVNDANWNTASKHKGSATCTVVELGDDGQSLNTLNVGDSGYSIHRWSSKTSTSTTTDSDSKNNNKLEVVFASIPGQKRFNFPYQLGGQYGHDVKEVGVVNQHTLQENDIIIVYSDGVSDNLYPEDYHDCLLDGSIRKGKSKNDKDDDDDDTMDIDIDSTEVVVDWPSLSWIADCIARHAYMKGKDKSFLSPFAIGARESGFRADYIGGKHDDITVTVAQVVDNIQTANKRILNDKYIEESIYLYTGHVKSKQFMPKLESVVIINIGEEEEEEEGGGPSLVGVGGGGGGSDEGSEL